MRENIPKYLGAKTYGTINIYRALGGGWEIREGKEFVPELIVKAMEKRTNWGGLLAHTPVPTEPPTNLFRLPQW